MSAYLLLPLNRVKFSRFQVQDNIKRFDPFSIRNYAGEVATTLCSVDGNKYIKSNQI